MRDWGNGNASELHAAIVECRRFFFAVGIFSIVVNVLMLTGPLFMLQVYDRVLPSKSESTLVALVVILVYLYAIMGILDYVRGRVLARVGARIHKHLDARVLDATFKWASSPMGVQIKGLPPGIQDLDAIERWVAGPGPIAVLDAPWLPFFILVLFMFHWMLGVYAAICAVILLIVAVASFLTTNKLERELSSEARQVYEATDHARHAADTVVGIGVHKRLIRRVVRKREETLAKSMLASDRRGAFYTATKTLRMLLQSLMLGLGAWLAISNAISPGVMIAATILLGRALAPLDSAISQWPHLQAALRGYRALSVFLRAVPESTSDMQLGEAVIAQLRDHRCPVLEMQDVVLMPPGARTPIVRGISIELLAGQAIGVFGASGSGKSTIARAIIGLTVPVNGSIRFAGIPPEQYDDVVRGRSMGWVPQSMFQMPVTIAETIARLDPEPDEAKVIRAGQLSGAHEHIISLPEGYSHIMDATLSGSLRQQIMIARALYATPPLIVFDEPIANIDRPGKEAFQNALSTYVNDGGAAFVLSHEPSTFQNCNRVYQLNDGTISPMRVVRHMPATPSLASTV